MNACETLEQRWSACRVQAKTYGPTSAVSRCCAWFRNWPLGFSIARPRSDRWYCTSPRRHQCRAGASPIGRSWANGWPGDLCTVQRVPYGPVQQRMRVPVTNGRWDWFNADLEWS